MLTDFNYSFTAHILQHIYRVTILNKLDSSKVRRLATHWFLCYGQVYLLIAITVFYLSDYNEISHAGNVPSLYWNGTLVVQGKEELVNNIWLIMVYGHNEGHIAPLLEEGEKEERQGWFVGCCRDLWICRSHFFKAIIKDILYTVKPWYKQIWWSFD